MPKPKRTVYHVVPGESGWNVEKEGGQRPSATTRTKQEAVERARELAKQQRLGQIKIHKQDGTIQTERTYGQDPEKYEG